MMKSMLAFAAIATSASAKKSPLTPEMKKNLATLQSEGISAESSFGRHLISQARRVEQNGNYDMSFMANYSIKFLGCHHVTQWNSDADEDDGDQQNNNQGNANGNEMSLSNSRIQSKGLVRFRLCPSNSCRDGFSVGCSKDYGEYVVDMVQFLEVYVAWQMEEQEYKCATYRNTCYKECFESTNGNCYTKCYNKYGVNVALCASADEYGNAYSGYGDNTASTPFTLEDYLECAEYDFGGDTDDVVHYLGPYCAQQGGDIRLGFFTDDTCTLASAYQATYFEKLTGIEVPYTKNAIVSTSCISCEMKDDASTGYQQDYYNYDAQGNKNYYAAKYVNEMCGTMYMQSGKCETNMNSEDVPYPEEGACAYIEGVKRLKSDGIIRNSNTVSSKPAAISIGVFTGLAVMLGGYVYYLKSKIARSRVNLAGANVSLT
ncbi:hypothetical protein HJC23_002805 [Cyclotella cryptica]|uniref:Uncharacterized protein n=1 Tax=Cyclotella cryptica TaxID=29204 RepID=A0ABD3PM31_9STRA|eukprot:CCRYP_013071-RC/>CCRYP_013071-RC protein AED:0.16 eAED:0.16 QI:0/-1/0/1/-1/1/1/0/430